MNTHRRIFRGRGGPTDGRLPKHNARRRRQKQAAKPAVNKYGDDDPKIEREEDEGEASSTSSLEIVEDAVMATVHAEPTTTAALEEEPWREEIKHLQKRMRNVQESIQTGTEGIANPKIYKENVLHAVSNCINEWRAILKHYELPAPEENILEVHPGVEVNTGVVEPETEAPPEAVEEESSSEDDESGEEEVVEVNPSTSATTYNPPSTCIDPQITKDTALQVYMLLQLSLQSGPLAGGKPGYFKRCGGAVAKLVQEYLDEVVPNHSATINLRFSLKQANAIEGWRRNATKAALQDREPSKTATKKQSGKSKKKKSTKL